MDRYELRRDEKGIPRVFRDDGHVEGDVVHWLSNDQGGTTVITSPVLNGQCTFVNLTSENCDLEQVQKFLKGLTL